MEFVTATKVGVDPSAPAPLQVAQWVLMDRTAVAEDNACVESANAEMPVLLLQ